MRVAGALLFVVFAAAFLIVPSDFAQAQTSPRDCASENRVDDPDGDTSQCGACVAGRLWNGTHCVTESGGFDTATFQADCAGASGEYSPIYRNLDDVIAGNSFGLACFNIGATQDDCLVLTDPDINLATQGLTDNEGNNPTTGSVPDCLSVTAYAPCVSPQVKSSPGNPFSACGPPTTCEEGEYNDGGTCRCTTGYEPDGSGGCRLCAGGRTSQATTATTAGMCACPDSARNLDLTGENCVAFCPPGQQLDTDLEPNQCEVCPPGFYNKEGTGTRCVSCENGETGDAQNGGATSCSCNPGYELNEISGLCVALPEQTIRISAGANGTLTAEWSGGALRDGGKVWRGATITFTAAPDPGYYVSAWSGCAGDVDDNRDGGPEECEAAANSDLNVDATFRDIDECAVNNGGCVNGACENSAGSFMCECSAGFGGKLCDADLPRVQMVVPAGGATLHATPEADCYVQGWATPGPCSGADVGSSDAKGSAGRKSCVSSGMGEVTVGVYFDCGP